MQPTASQIDEQVKLERDQIAQGLKRLHDDTRRSEERSYASACVYGIASIDMLLPLVVKRIEDTNNRIKEGKNGVAFKEIQQYISGLEPLAAAAIAPPTTAVTDANSWKLSITNLTVSAKAPKTFAAI